MKELVRILTLSCGALMASAALHAGGSRYVVGPITTTDLGTLGGAQSMAYDINNAGSVVGWAETAAGIKHASLHEAGTVIDVGSALGAIPSEARGINSSSVIVGFVEDANGPHAFRWMQGALIFLHQGRNCCFERISEAHAIADTGLIAGVRYIPEWPDLEATVWVDADTAYFIDRGDFLFSVTNDINSDGYVVGSEWATGTGVRWRFNRTETTRVSIPPPISFPGFPFSEPLAINQSGGIVGWVNCCAIDRSSGTRATYWDGLAEFSTDLGVLPTGDISVAEGINSNTFIAGYADKAVRIGVYVDVQVESAFIYHRDFGMVELPKPASIAFLGGCRATALNDLRINRIQVAGHCETASGLRAVRWDVTVWRLIVIGATTSPRVEGRQNS